MSAPASAPSPMSNGKYIVTPATFDRKRVALEPKPTFSDSTNGDSFSAKYKYVGADGKDKLEYIHTVMPTLSCVYGCGQNTLPDANEPKADAKFSLCLGFRIVNKTDPRPAKMIYDDNTGELLRMEDFPRSFLMQEQVTGNGFRGDDVKITPKHAQDLLDYYKMITEIDAEIREQLAKVLASSGKTPSPIANNVVRKSKFTEYQDIHAKVTQYVNKTGPKAGERTIALKVLVAQDDPSNPGKQTFKRISFEEFVEKSGGARVDAWLTFPSVHVSFSGNATVRCTVDQVFVRRLGVHPESSRESVTVDLSELPSDEPIVSVAAAEGASSPPAKRARTEDYGVATEADEEAAMHGL